MPGDSSTWGAVPRGIGKSRGSDGIRIGPETPVRGFKDLLNIDKHHASRMHPMAHTLDSASARVLCPGLLESVGAIPFRLTHCGYTDSENATARLRLRTKGISWSLPFSLTSPSPVSVELAGPRGASVRYNPKCTPNIHPT
jgi:hypothetical protein